MRFSASEVTTAASLSQPTRGFRCFWARVVTPINIAEFVVHVLEPPVGTIGGFLSAHTLILKPSGMLPPKAWLPPLRHFANTFVPRYRASCRVCAWEFIIGSRVRLMSAALALGPNLPRLAAVKTPQREQDLAGLAPKRGLMPVEPIEWVTRKLGEADKCPRQPVEWIICA